MYFIEKNYTIDIAWYKVAHVPENLNYKSLTILLQSNLAETNEPHK